MKFEFDEMNFKDEIELMNLQNQIKQKQMNQNQSIGFNMDTLYNFAESDKTQD